MKQNVGDITARNAWRYPRRDAIVDVPNRRRLTFAQLDDRVNRLAHGLRTRCGLATGDRVAILGTNCAEIVEAFFACAKAGLVAQPLNWRLAVPELARIIEDGAPGVLLYHREFHAVVEELEPLMDVAHLIEWSPGRDSAYEDLLAAHDPGEPPWSAGTGDDDGFFILYTGGTTGVSKGALHTHASALAAMLNQTVAERITHDDVYMLTGQMFHIPVVLAMNYLAHGRPVVLVNFEPASALEVIETERVSAFLGITTMLNYLMAAPTFGSTDLSSLRLIMYGGGPMAESVVRQIMDAFPCELMQGYGQTEGGTMSFLLPWVHQEIRAGKGGHRAASCGQEGFVTSLRVVDANGLAVPRDRKAIGEIVVRSPANMAGYWQRPRETAEVFRDGGGWMRTGDLATWDDDGFLYIVDRAKDMVISGGENIYPAQVEEVLYRHPAILEAAVFGVPDDTWGESLHAVVVRKPGAEVSAEELIELCRRELASYMKPRAVEFAAALPKGPTGKILKRELRAPHWEGRERSV